MSSIRELVLALRARNGVTAAILVGRDGLVIDADTGGTVDAERLAALVPLAVSTAEELGSHAQRDSLATAVLEYENGAAIITTISPDAMLLVIAELDELAPLLFELRRNRSRLASLV